MGSGFLELGEIDDIIDDTANPDWESLRGLKWKFEIEKVAGTELCIHNKQKFELVKLKKMAGRASLRDPVFYFHYGMVDKLR